MLFWLDCLIVFVSIQSNSFDVNSDELYLLKIWIYQLLPFNIQQRSAQQSTIYAHELSCYFLRILSIFSAKLYCLCLATVALDTNVEPLKKWNSVVTIRWKCCRNFVLRNITVWNYLLRNLFKIRLSENRLSFYMTAFQEKRIKRKEYCSEVHGKTIEDARWMFLTYFIKRTKLQETFINAQTLSK